MSKKNKAVIAVSNLIAGLSLFKSHKVVAAAKITVVGDVSADGSVSLSLELLGGKADTVVVDAEWLTRNPAVEAGGYFVQYVENADGYTAYSPAEPFESGYVPYDPDAQPQNYVESGCEVSNARDRTQAETDLETLAAAQEIRQDKDRCRAARAIAGNTPIQW